MATTMFSANARCFVSEPCGSECAYCSAKPPRSAKIGHFARKNSKFCDFMKVTSPCDMPVVKAGSVPSKFDPVLLRPVRQCLVVGKADKRGRLGLVAVCFLERACEVVSDHFTQRILKLEPVSERLVQHVFHSGHGADDEGFGECVLVDGVPTRPNE